MRNLQPPWFQPGSAGIRSRGRLSHWEAETGAYFVTFRLADSLPAPVLRMYRDQREDIVKSAAAQGRELTPLEIRKLDDLRSEKIETFLDTGAGSCRLADPRVAAIVKNALFHFHGDRYRLMVWCIMPNHVHVAFRPSQLHLLSDIMHSWKSFTAKEMNGLLRLSGEFWQREYYDHLIRDAGDYCRIAEYVLANPDSAAIKDWPWVGTCDD